ncbi:MAG: HAD family hydrolase [candidate division Zixibacteria bacterium]|nr:HAD family hydrolase [candidate division Zixibacteria bacterium]
MIDTITFDLWNTLISNQPIDNHRYRQKRVEGIRWILEQNGLNVRFDDLALAYDKGFEKCNETWRKNLDLSTEEQLEVMFDFLEDEKLRNLPRNLMPELVETFVSPILDEPPSLIEGANETLQQTKKENYKIGLICNTGRTPGKTIRILLERFGMIHYFDVTTFSNELRIRKPDPRIFLYTLDQLKSHPKTSLHIGDIVELDVLGAKNAGMISVHYNPNKTSYASIHSQDIRLAPDFSIKRLMELEIILNEIEESFSDLNN